MFQNSFSDKHLDAFLVCSHLVASTEFYHYLAIGRIYKDRLWHEAANDFPQHMSDLRNVLASTAMATDSICR